MFCNESNAPRADAGDLYNHALYPEAGHRGCALPATSALTHRHHAQLTQKVVEYSSSGGAVYQPPRPYIFVVDSNGTKEGFAVSALCAAGACTRR